VLNGRIWSSPPEPPRPGGPSALAIAGERIQAVGSDANLRLLADPETTILDAAGGLVLPGINDAHVHFLDGARHLANLELSAERTVEGILTRVSEFAAGHLDRDWLLGRGWLYALFPGAMPDRDLLDRVIADRPVALEAYDSHTTWVNTAALSRLGITDSTADPAGGEIQRDGSGRATGILKETAMELVNRALPPPSTAADLAMLKQAVRLAHAHGLTSVQEAGAGVEQFAVYQALEESGQPAIRIRIGMRMEPGLSMSEWEKRLLEYESVARPYGNHSWISSGIVKAFADGVVESGTAAMLSPYEGMAAENPGALGSPQWQWPELAEAVGVADARGWQVQIHAVGDGAVRAALDAFERAAARNPPRDRRHRIEHIETIAAGDIPRFRQLGVIASMQPLHANPETAQIGLYTSRIGTERMSRAWPWTSLNRTGGRLAFGSDWPIVSFDPFLGLNCAVNRTTPDGQPPGGSLPGERLSVAEAVAAYTAGAAWAEFAEEHKGRLAPGMLADVVILDRDVLAAPSSAIVDARVEATIVGGRLAYRRS
jgi:predicted amidohydrolase YtcJ